MAMNYINMSSENQTFYGKDMEPGVVQSVPGPINANDFLQISKAPDADVPDDNTDALAKMIENTITAIEFPKSVTKVGNYGFYGRNLITTVSIPARISSIGDYGFAECAGLVTINIPDTCTSIGNSAFSKCALRTIDFPDNAVLGGGVCQNCKSLENVNLPANLKAIPSGAFQGCTSLTAIDIPSSVETIGTSAFASCTALNEVSFSSGLSVIGDHVFSGCSALKSVSIPEGTTSIEGGCFIQSGVETVELPSSLTSLGSDNPSMSNASFGTFSFCQSLRSVNLEDTSITKITPYTFYACSSLNTITIPDAITEIGEYAFAGTMDLPSGLTEVEIPGTVSTIPRGMCSLCNLLTSVTLKSGVTSIGERAFEVGGRTGAEFAESCVIDIPSTVTSINARAFTGRGVEEDCTINIHKSSGSISGAPWGAKGSKVTINWLG